MNKTEAQVQCVTCQWNKYCIEPPSMTKEEVEEKLNKSKEEVIPEEGGTGKLLGGLMTTLFFSGKDLECKVCPVFAQQLRESPELSQKIKDIMKKI